MAYDPRTMFTEIAPVSTEPPKPWFECPGCGTQYSTEAQARGCREAHVRYGRSPTSMFQDVPVPPPSGRKSKVFITESKQAICGLCASKKVEEGFLEVEMLDPPICGRCDRQIEPDPEQLVEDPNFLPPSERREIRRLGVTRRAQVERFDKRLHAELMGVAAHTVLGDLDRAAHPDLAKRGCTLDGRLTRAHGLYRNDPFRGDQRLPGCGHIAADPDAEPVEFTPYQG